MFEQRHGAPPFPSQHLAAPGSSVENTSVVGLYTCVGVVDSFGTVLLGMVPDSVV